MRARFVSCFCVFALTAAAAVGCEQGGATSPKAAAELKPLGDSTVGGTVDFTRLSSGRIRVVADLSGMAPGEHGLHIHEYGDCSDPNGLLAGDHFNPDGVKHGGPTAAEHHAGDLGNITADSNGRGYMTFETDDFKLDTGPRGVLGRSVIVHAMRDDLLSQPAGNSGDRVACGVIRSSSGSTEPVTPDDDK